MKVFEARLGFFDSVVAAPSQAAALRAWGTHQNLFADGRARVTQDVMAVEAALAHPGVPLRRAIGSSAAYAEASDALPNLPDMPVGSRRRGTAKPAADRSALDAAERALGDLAVRRNREEAEFERRRAALDADMAAARDAYAEAHHDAKATVAAARAAFRKAGGTG